MILSERGIPIGAHVTQEVKEALREASSKTNKSMSAFIFEAIQEKLEREGIEIKKYKDNRTLPLPMEPVNEPTR